ncbi:HAMP domain-containing sensor histidine kinase [Verrucomicrobium sp. BvORR034]|uniref:HAMP domain-containing sensor histidine kinase n=1 Tax=Verrucomicrobium sp. BvORR034 TaxID=1396418 RepID=UPI0006786702|nr:HAMP domain-containing sensor histidine kinase [Verrucomicrobium sp. BvORR034]
MRKLSLRLKIALWSALVVAVALVPTGIFTLIHVYHEQLEATQERLLGTSRHYIDMASKHRGESQWGAEQTAIKIFHPGGQPERFVEIADEQGEVVCRSANVAPGVMAGLPQGFSYVHLKGKPVRALVTESKGVVVRYAMDLDEVYDATKELAVAYLIALPFLLTVIYVGGGVISGKALAPVRLLAQTAEQITAADLGKRLPAATTQDEIGRLTNVFNEMLDRLQVSFNQATRFSADASHELKTPLTLLRAGVEDLLESSEVPSHMKPPLNALLEQTTLLASIVGNLLLLSRMDARQFKLDFAMQNASEILESCLEDAIIMAEDRGLNFEAQIPAELMVPVDQSRFTQIIHNLLDNAIKYNIPQGTIKVTAREEEAFAVIRIANTSVARHEVASQQLFERFYREEHSASVPGRGLGLSLARELARAHGGDVTLEGSDGHWTEFKIRLPLRHAGE